MLKLFHIKLVLIYLCGIKTMYGDYSNTWLIQTTMDKSELEVHAAENGFKVLYQLSSGYYALYNDGVERSSKRKSSRLTKKLANHRKIKFVEQERWEKVQQHQASSFSVQDPMWSKSWYLNERSSQSMGILDAWKSGYTGKGIFISIVDDGIDDTHPDLTNKIDRSKSRDVYDNSGITRPGPTFGHGTKCAGIAGAEKNNVCVIGSAYNATLVAIRMIGARGVLPSGRAEALRTNVDISSDSWGGLDKTFATVDSQAASALHYGISQGRGGKGVIYVFAGGNGGFDDNCNMDGYVSSIYTISINGVTRDHTAPGYAEQCSAVLASAYTGPGGSKDNICTTSKNSGCIEDFSGTSAATPLVAGALALVLEANPNLHWRDLQELIVRTSNLNVLKYTQAKTNGVGRQVSDIFGYGLIDVHKMITTATSWKNLPEQHTCPTVTNSTVMRIVPNHTIREVESRISTEGCNDTTVCVNSMEHVTAHVTFSYTFRAITEIILESPSGTESQLLTIRNDDRARNGQMSWTFMSVHFWGEDPKGVWRLKLKMSSQISEGGYIDRWMLTIYGTGVGCTSNKSSTIVCSKPFATSAGCTTNETGPSGLTTDVLSDWKIALIVSGSIVFVCFCCVGAVAASKRQKRVMSDKSDSNHQPNKTGI